MFWAIKERDYSRQMQIMYTQNHFELCSNLEQGLQVLFSQFGGKGMNQMKTY